MSSNSWKVRFRSGGGRIEEATVNAGSYSSALSIAHQLYGKDKVISVIWAGS